MTVFIYGIIVFYLLYFHILELSTAETSLCTFLRRKHQNSNQWITQNVHSCFCSFFSWNVCSDEFGMLKLTLVGETVTLCSCSRQWWASITGARPVVRNCVGGVVVGSTGHSPACLMKGIQLCFTPILCTAISNSRPHCPCQSRHQWKMCGAGWNCQEADNPSKYTALCPVKSCFSYWTLSYRSHQSNPTQ